MWAKRQGESLDIGLSHSGHAWSSLWDELTCCWVRSLVAHREKCAKIILSVRLLLEAIKTKMKHKFILLRFQVSTHKKLQN